MKFIVAFVRFWYDFVVGDDWQVAVGVLIAIGVTAALARGDIASWWLMPLAVMSLLSYSLWRATRDSHR